MFCNGYIAMDIMDNDAYAWLLILKDTSVAHPTADYLRPKSYTHSLKYSNVSPQLELPVTEGHFLADHDFRLRLEASIAWREYLRTCSVNEFSNTLNKVPAYKWPILS